MFIFAGKWLYEDPECIPTVPGISSGNNGLPHTFGSASVANNQEINTGLMF